MELIPMLNQKLGNDIDGANFMTFMRGNGQECAEMAREVKKILAEHNLSVSQIKGFLEYMKINVESYSYLHSPKQPLSEIPLTLSHLQGFLQQY